MRLLVFFQFILCMYSSGSYGDLLNIRAESGKPTEEKNEKCAKIPEKKQTQKTEDAVLQKEILKIRLPRHDDVSIYYHFRFFIDQANFLISLLFFL